MRQIWVLGEDMRVQSRLQAILANPRYGVKYVVSNAASLSDVPEEHLSNDGVLFVVDAFHPQYPGFDGLVKLRAKGFEGAVVLLGEPAPEDAAGPFQKNDMTAFLPSVDRIDISYLAGVVHYKLNYQGELDLKHFLEASGKASIEQITNLKEFNQLVLKLMNFVSRFGVNIQKLKRTLVGLSASHVKNTPKGPTVTESFKLCYGIDGAKLIVGVSFDGTKGLAEEKSEFFAALTSFKTGKSTGKRGDFFNVAKISSNLALVGGSATGSGATEAYILTSISFAKSDNGIVDPYSFAWIEAKKTDELPESKDAKLAVPEMKMSSAEDLSKLQAAAKAKKSDPLKAVDMSGEGKEVDVSSQEVVKPKTESTSVLDTPLSAVASQGVRADSSPEISKDDSIDVAELKEKIKALESEIFQGTEVSQALSEDVKRLMKERREPLTDADLKESLNEMTRRAKRLQEQNKNLTAQIDKQESQVELLKAQVERLKLNAA